MFKTFYKENGDIDIKGVRLIDNDNHGRTTIMSSYNSDDSSPKSVKDVEQGLNYDIRHKTVHNSDIYRTSAAINVFNEQLQETIKVY